MKQKKSKDKRLNDFFYYTREEIYPPENYDKLFHSWLGQFTNWLSPASYTLSFVDWLLHLGMSPTKQVDLLQKAALNQCEWIEYYIKNSFNKNCKDCIKAHPNDSRFDSNEWSEFPFNMYSQGFLLLEKWWNHASHDVNGAGRHHLKVVNFLGRQMLDVFSPSNFILTNPEVLNKTIEQGGLNLIKGLDNLTDDIYRKINGLAPAGVEQYQVGKDVAITEGKVIYQNHLIELIQYDPVTSKVYPEPVLIIPAWIMKYYILDLSPHNSMVKYLVSKGHTVFMISWKNPKSEDADLGLDDYINFGIFNAMNVINQIIPDQKLHAVGYCLGGTLLMMAAGFLANINEDRLKTITLFAAQVDFKEAGELLLFVDESQVSYLEDIMWKKGYLDGSQMAGTFSMLHSIDLVWSKMVREYLLGQRENLNDLMAWDYDTTRLPYKMHSEYLRKLFLNNDLVQGNIRVNKRKIALHDIKIPLFVVSTERDHIAPWKSVYKVHLFTGSEVTFVLTSGGHNAGIVSEPGHPNRDFRIYTHKIADKYITSEKWLDVAAYCIGSWWPEWHDWLAQYSGEKGSLLKWQSPSSSYLALRDAPGSYIYDK